MGVASLGFAAAVMMKVVVVEIGVHNFCYKQREITRAREHKHGEKLTWYSFCLISKNEVSDFLSHKAFSKFIYGLAFGSQEPWN